MNVLFLYASTSINSGHIVFGMCVCLSVCLSAKKLLHSPYLLIGKIKGRHFYMSIACDKTFLWVSSSKLKSDIKVTVFEKIAVVVAAQLVCVQLLELPIHVTVNKICIHSPLLSFLYSNSKMGCNC